MRRTPNGFTIIEMLVVVLIMGILASIAMIKVGNSKDKPKLVAVKSDVRNVELAEESYFSDNGSYGSMNQLRAVGLTVSPGVLIRITANTTGYTIRASDATIASSIKGCSVQVGTTASSDGVISCP